MKGEVEDERERFHVLKRAVELYLIELDCYIEVPVGGGNNSLLNDVEKMDILTYFEEKDPHKSIVAVILDSYNPNTLVKQEVYYKLSSRVDTAIANDIIVAWGKDTLALFRLGRPHSVNKKLRKLEAEFFVDQHHRCSLDMQKILALEWSAEVSIHTFTENFLDLLKRCRTSALFQDNYEAMILFRLKLSHQRSQNSAIYNAITDLDSMEDDTDMGRVLEVVMATILRKHADGIVPYDDFQFVGHRALNGMVFLSQLHANTSSICYGCGGNFPHTGKCPARHVTCSHCSRLGHFDKMNS